MPAPNHMNVYCDHHARRCVPPLFFVFKAGHPHHGKRLFAEPSFFTPHSQSEWNNDTLQILVCQQMTENDLICWINTSLFILGMCVDRIWLYWCPIQIQKSEAEFIDCIYFIYHICIQFQYEKPISDPNLTQLTKVI